MSSSLVRSTYRRMMKYFLRHWCMEIKYDGDRTKKNGQDAHEKSDGHDKQNRNTEKKTCQMTKVNLDKRTDDDGILLDAQLEWEHEEVKEFLKKVCTSIFGVASLIEKQKQLFSSECQTNDCFYFLCLSDLELIVLGIEHSPKTYRKSEQDLVDILLTQSPCSTTHIRAPSSCPDFEWDHLFDFNL